MKKYILPFLILSGLCFNLYSQQNAGAGKWTTSKPFEQYGFIENKGQFCQEERADIGQKILYSTFKGKLHIYFLANGIKFRCDSTYAEAEANKEPERNIKTKHIFSGIQWVGANTFATVEVQDELSNYYTYGNSLDVSGQSGIVCHAWKKLIYRNIYPNIDIEFYYPEDKGGMEYNIIVRPGGDPSLVKMNYTSGSSLSMEDNAINIISPVAHFTDHAPTAVTEDGNSVGVLFALNGNTVSFNVSIYDRTKQLVIDPWVTSPVLSGNNKAYDVDCDLSNNAYVYGGEYPYQVVKLNSAGVIQ